MYGNECLEFGTQEDMETAELQVQTVTVTAQYSTVQYMDMSAKNVSFFYCSINSPWTWILYLVFTSLKNNKKS